VTPCNLVDNIQGTYVQDYTAPHSYRREDLRSDLWRNREQVKLKHRLLPLRSHRSHDHAPNLFSWAFPDQLTDCQLLIRAILSRQRAGRPENRGSFPGRGTQRPDRLWGPPSLLSSGLGRVVRRLKVCGAVPRLHVVMLNV
jgi:hypothetical protein